MDGSPPPVVLTPTEVLSRVTTQRLVLGLRRGVLRSRVADARDAGAEAAALRGQARQITSTAWILGQPRGD